MSIGDGPQRRNYARFSFVQFLTQGSKFGTLFFGEFHTDLYHRPDALRQAFFRGIIQTAPLPRAYTWRPLLRTEPFLRNDRNGTLNDRFWDRRAGSLVAGLGRFGIGSFIP